MFLENAVSVAVLKRCKRQEGMRMKGDEKIRANAVQPIFGEVISVPQLAKGMDLKEGEDLEYTTPMGLHIKAHIEKGAPVNVEFFHDGESIKPELTVKAIDLSGIPDIEWECAMSGSRTPITLERHSSPYTGSCRYVGLNDGSYRKAHA
ncbi:MAG: hypothetical protein ACXVH6_02575 [Halobacteriota archaeon]